MKREKKCGWCEWFEPKRPEIPHGDGRCRCDPVWVMTTSERKCCAQLQWNKEAYDEMTLESDRTRCELLNKDYKEAR